MSKGTGFRLDGLLWGGAAAALAAALSGCGGGLLLGIGTNSNDPPVVSMLAASSAGVRGSSMRLFADASDDDAVARVIFFQVTESGDELEVGRDSDRPYAADVKLPDSSFGPTSVNYFARAVDSDGASTDSARVTVELKVN